MLLFCGTYSDYLTLHWTHDTETYSKANMMCSDPQKACFYSLSGWFSKCLFNFDGFVLSRQ